MTDAARQYGTALYELCREEDLVKEILPQLKTLEAIACFSAREPSS